MLRWFSVGKFSEKNKCYIDICSSIGFAKNCLPFQFQCIRIIVGSNFDKIQLVSGTRNVSDLLLKFLDYQKNKSGSSDKKMTSGYSILQLKEDDVLKILAAQLHIGSKDVDYQMDTYVWKKKPRNEGSNSIE